jgi:hypothetical protein
MAGRSPADDATARFRWRHYETRHK